MDKRNLIHKTLIITMAALFIVNQSVLSRIERDLHNALPELQVGKEAIDDVGGDEPAYVVVTLSDDRIVEGYFEGLANDGLIVIDPSTGNTSKIAYRTVKEINESEPADDTLPDGMITFASAGEPFERLVY
jgi:hypothetical protein